MALDSARLAPLLWEARDYRHFLRLYFDAARARNPRFSMAGFARAAGFSSRSFPREVALGLPAAAVVACRDAALRDLVGAAMGTTGFRLYGGDDPVGVQVGGAAKNVIAIAAGAVIGAGLFSLTGIAAAGPMSPSPSTAVPSVTTATVLETQV